MSARSRWAAAAAFAVGATIARAQAPEDLSATLTRVADRVEAYYRRAQSVLCLETVTVQSLGPDLGSNGSPRTLEYELRVSWEPSADGSTPPAATVVRQLLRVDGHAPVPGVEARCTDPLGAFRLHFEAVSPEPLAMMLRDHQHEYTFSMAGTDRVKNRRAIRIDYRSRTIGEAKVTWHGECYTVALPGRTRGRIWVDATTHEVLRLDEGLLSRFNYTIPPEHSVPGAPAEVEIQRADSSVHFRPVVFTNPDETMLLPDRIDSLQIVDGAGTPRVRMTQTFSKYRRFVTDARVVQ